MPFEQQLQKYAHLLMHKGLNISANDYVQINADIEMAPLVRLLVEEAYELGADCVIVDWSDEALAPVHYNQRPLEVLTTVEDYEVAKAERLLEQKTKRLSLRSQDPNGLASVDANKLSQAQLARSKAFQPIQTATQANEVSWLVAAGAGQQWAKQVFPTLETTQEQVAALWDAIFDACRVNTPDPIRAWDEHEATLNAKAKFLNEQQFDALHFQDAVTDLTMGLPKDHVWESAGSLNRQEEAFIANIPTEEVFTAPDSRRCDGVVVSTKPLSYGGNIIDGMRFTFKDGEVVEATATQGEETLQQLLESNDGAKRLGEVALVPHQSPISQSGIIFYNTLFDENASNHVALGQAYATSVQNGTQMSQDELAQAGLNRSNVHVDFMIGSSTMSVDGIDADGHATPIFRQGEWVI